MKLNLFIGINVSLLLCALTLGCRTTGPNGRDALTYFQPSGSDSAAVGGPRYVFRLQPGDVLNINVASLSPELDVAFNPFNRAQANAPATANAQDNNNLPPGYRVDAQGTINFPKLGRLNVAGQSTSDLETLLTDRLQAHLREPFVTVRLLNFKVSVMGEVSRPAVFTVQNERITLPEALSLAGDLTIFGRRDNVLVVREAGGQRQFGRVDLTDRQQAFTSAYYYLQPNDVVYVEPIGTRKLSTRQEFVWLPTALSAASLLLLIVINIVRR